KTESKGRIVINQLPSALGTPPAHFDLARNGVADVVIGVPGYTPGRFVSDKLYTLPFLGNTATAVSVAAWKTHNKFFAPLEEYKGVHVLGIFSHGPGQIHAKKELKSLSDFSGLKMRVTGGYLRDIATALKMVPLLKPATESYELLSTGVADGTLLPVESMAAFNLQKLVPHTAIVPGGFYFATFFMGMNEEKYLKLKPEDRAAIDRASGEVLVRLGAGVFDARDKRVLGELKSAGHKFNVVSPALAAEMKKETAHIERLWLDEIKTKGINGDEALAFFRREILANEPK
ncbi:MAG: TRAP transporter substrate-binding protein, partial [Burkholderiaceae bacterium]|nr:TRAP transporter substrate-binding protein [Burkholderiaceae bacterium]